MKRKTHTPDLIRRRLLAGMAAVPLASCGRSDPGSVLMSQSAPIGALPNPQDSGIDHIIVVMMENRSFDHLLGWLPGADGVQAGMKYPDKNGALQDTYDLAPEFQGCAFEDPDHSYKGGHTQYNNGKLDGFLQTVKDAAVKFPIGYYTAASLPFYAGAAPAWTVCDRYFPGILSQTFPNRFYMHSGQTDRNDNNLTTMSTLPTIWDRLASKGFTGGFYFSDVPIIGLWGAKYASITQQFSGFLLDCATGSLPNVSFVDPNFGGSAGEGFGASQDDHPFADVRDGQAFLNQVYNAVRASPNWEKTLLVINYDEWGGFYDHVAPPAGPVSDAERAIGNLDGLLGFRVPCLLIGPRARRGHVEHMVFEPNSILDFIRWRFGLDPLSVRSDRVNNLALALDFNSAPNLDAPTFDVPTGLAGTPFGQPCAQRIVPGVPLPSDPPAASRIAHYNEWRALGELARRHGFVLPA